MMMANVQYLHVHCYEPNFKHVQFVSTAMVTDVLNDSCAHINR